MVNTIREKLTLRNVVKFLTIFVNYTVIRNG